MFPFSRPLVAYLSHLFRLLVKKKKCAPNIRSFQNHKNAWHTKRLKFVISEFWSQPDVGPQFGFGHKLKFAGERETSLAPNSSQKVTVAPRPEVCSSSARCSIH